MSAARVFRYLIGVIAAAILLAIVLPFVGVPRSHYLPPAWVYTGAKGVTRGYITAKYYDVTNNPFDVGGKQWFIKYQFRAQAVNAQGLPEPGQVYYGIVRVDQPTYHEVKAALDINALDSITARHDIPATPGQIVRVRYEKTDPYINGIDATWGGRNIGAMSNNLSGWIIWSLVTLIVAYLIMLLFERFGNKENI